MSFSTVTVTCEKKPRKPRPLIVTVSADAFTLSPSEPRSRAMPLTLTPMIRSPMLRLSENLNVCVFPPKKTLKVWVFTHGA